MQGTAALAGQPSLGTRVLEAILSDLLFPLPQKSGQEERANDETPRGVSLVTVAARPTSEGFEVLSRANSAPLSLNLPSTDAALDGSARLELRQGRIWRAVAMEELSGASVRARMT